MEYPYGSIFLLKKEILEITSFQEPIFPDIPDDWAFPKYEAKKNIFFPQTKRCNERSFSAEVSLYVQYTTAQIKKNHRGAKSPPTFNPQEECRWQKKISNKYVNVKIVTVKLR
jgi:hypothetical protein